MCPAGNDPSTSAFSEQRTDHLYERHNYLVIPVLSHRNLRPICMKAWAAFELDVPPESVSQALTYDSSVAS